MLFSNSVLFSTTQGVPEFVSSSDSDCQYTLRWTSAAACPTDMPSSETSASSCSLVDPFANDLVLDFRLFISHVTLTTPDNHGGSYTIQLCGSASPTHPPHGCDQQNTSVCRQYADGHNATVVYANHTFSLVSHSPRVIDAVFHSGVTCEADASRRLSAVVQMVCSNQSENAVPVLVSDQDCELRFVWRNQSFCAGESAAGGCSAVDPVTGYVYSLDGLLAQNWTVSLYNCVYVGDNPLPVAKFLSSFLHLPLRSGFGDPHICHHVLVQWRGELLAGHMPQPQPFLLLRGQVLHPLCCLLAHRRQQAHCEWPSKHNLYGKG